MRCPKCHGGWRDPLDGVLCEDCYGTGEVSCCGDLGLFDPALVEATAVTAAGDENRDGQTETRAIPGACEAKTGTGGGARAVAIARTWIGTPYHHAAAVKGVGCDCLGLLRGVAAELGLAVPATVPAYARDAGEADGVEGLLAAARAHLVEVPASWRRPGDVLVVRWRGGRLARHCGILAGATWVHALEGRGVVEVTLDPWLAARIAGVFRFPAVEESGR